jgi:hypothetical protein
MYVLVRVCVRVCEEIGVEAKSCLISEHESGFRSIRSSEEGEGFTYYAFLSYRDKFNATFLSLTLY